MLQLFLALACLFAGSALYILFRPTTLLMFHWTDAAAMLDSIVALRSHADFLKAFLPGWVIYSLPFALWVLSYLFLVNCVWGKSNSPWRAGYFWSVPAAAICVELAQGPHLLPGKFDPVDLATIIAATIVGFVASGFHHTTKRRTASCVGT